MLTQYRLTLAPDRARRARSEWGYRLYASLLERAGEGFAEAAHRDAVTPVSQFLTVSPDAAPVWTVSLLGEAAERALTDVLDAAEDFTLDKDGVTFRVAERTCRRVADVDALFAAAAQCGGRHRLLFRTAAAFKSQGRYLNLPTTRLIVQSLVKKWNGCVTECSIEDEDGEGLDALALGLRVAGFRLNDRLYYLKGSSIPGFTGELTLENRLSGFHRELADALLLFSAFAGVGIKTTLGMGGVENLSMPRGACDFREGVVK